MTIPSKVFITLKPSAPAFTTARAISVMSVTSGESLANKGILAETFLLTVLITSAAAVGSHAKTCPRFSTLGQEILTSIPTTPGISLNLSATLPNSSTLFPAIETIVLAPF